MNEAALDWCVMNMHTASEQRLPLPASSANAARGAIVFDPALAGQVHDAWFDPAWWGERAQPVSGSGRGAAWFVETPAGAAVLRHYRRGGLAARVSRSRYFWRDEAHVRSIAEFRLTQQLHTLGLPVPAPLAAAYWRDGPSYRAAILLQRLPKVHSLADYVRHDIDAAPWTEAGRLIALFHRAGLDHADLNAHNILFDGNGAGWLIDFDRGRLRTSQTAWRTRNLERLRRSLRKLRGAHAIAAIDAHFERLYAAYLAAWTASA